MTNRTTVINPKRFQARLSHIGVPYHSINQYFPLLKHLKTIECQYGSENYDLSKPIVIFDEEQVEHYQACVDSIENREHSGWTAIITSEANYNYAQAVAAQLAGFETEQDQGVLWKYVDANFNKATLDDICQPYDRYHYSTFIFTGLRMNGSSARFDKVIDWLNDVPSKANKIITATGSDPIKLARYMGIPVQRAIYVNDKFIVQM